jgi:hypothetical protein
VGEGLSLEQVFGTHVLGRGRTPVLCGLVVLIAKSIAELGDAIERLFGTSVLFGKVNSVRKRMFGSRQRSSFGTSPKILPKEETLSRLVCYNGTGHECAHWQETARLAASKIGR